jgi:phosphate transport system substrate-binding protein
MRSISLWAAVAATVASVVVAAATTSRAAEPEIWVQGAGATFPAPLYKKWIDAYTKSHPGVSITYDAVGSGEGVSRFVTGSVDFGASDSPLTEAEVARVTRGVIAIPGTAGMIVAAYSLPGLTGELKLPRDVYPDIFAGKITRWDDPRIQAANPDIKMPKRNIALVARLDGSGTTDAFTQHLAAVSEAWRGPTLKPGRLVNWPGTAMLARGNEGVASRIKISEGAIGYVEYGFAKRLGLPVAALQNHAGEFVRPTDKAGQVALAEGKATRAQDLRLLTLDPDSPQAYPIVTFSWLLVYGEYKDGRKGEALTNFVTWGLTEGQVLGSDLGYLALPPPVVSRGQAAVAGVRF